MLNIDTSYNMLLGRKWVHRVGAVASTLHQMVKFEHDRQEIVVHGEGDLSMYKDYSIFSIEADTADKVLIYQASKVVIVENILEGNLIARPQLSSASVMVVNEMLKHGFKLGKGLGISLQGRDYPVYLCENFDTFGLGYEPTFKDRKKAKKHKKYSWSVTKPIPPPHKSFIKVSVVGSSVLPATESMNDDDTKLIGLFQNIFIEDDMVEIGVETNNADVQFIGPDVQLNIWEATPLPTLKESWYLVYFSFCNLNCSRILIQLFTLVF